MEYYYNKLVRDKIPELIAESGKSFKIHVANNDEYRKYLDKKLKEEVDEYFESGNIEELADLEEVILAIVENKGTTRDKFENIRLNKLRENGAFMNRIILEHVN